jgi:hypothetical protein
MEEKSPGSAGAQVFIEGISRSADAATLADANVHRTPGPHARRDIHPRPSRTGIPSSQVDPKATPEPAKAEMPPVYEPVAMVNPMSELVDVGMPDVNPMIAVLVEAGCAVFAIPITVVQVVAALITAGCAVFAIGIVAVVRAAFAVVIYVVIAALLIVERSALRSLVSAAELRSPRHAGTIVAKTRRP